MSIRFRLIKAANGQNYGSIVMTYRDRTTKKSTTRSLKSYGHISDLKLEDKNFLAQVRHDIKYFKDQAGVDSTVRVKNTKEGTLKSLKRLNYSFFVLRVIFERLKCDDIFKEHETRIDIENFDDLVFYMAASRINDDESDFDSIDDSHIFSFDHIHLNYSIKALTYLASRAYHISKQINRELESLDIIDLSSVTYYLTKLNFQHIKNSIKRGALIENQCVLGLTLDNNHIPLDYHLDQISPGEKAERDDMLNRVIYIKNTAGRNKDFVFVADTELNKREYIYHLEKEKCPYILCTNFYKLSSRRQSLLLKSKFKKGRSTDGDSSWRYSEIKEDLTVRHFTSRIVLDCRIYLIYSKHKRAHDLWRLEKQWRAASNLVDMSDSIINSTGLLDEEVFSSSLMRFIKLQSSKPGLLSTDRNKYSRYGVFAGYFVVVTNSRYDINDIYLKLKKLWDYKESYRNPNLSDIRQGTYLNYKDLMAGHFFLANFSNIIKRSLMAILLENNIRLSSKQLKKAMHENSLCFIKDLNGFNRDLVIKNSSGSHDVDGLNSMDRILKALNLPVFDAIVSLNEYKSACSSHIKSQSLKLNI